MDLLLYNINLLIKFIKTHIESLYFFVNYEPTFLGHALIRGMLLLMRSVCEREEQLCEYMYVFS